MAGLGPAVVASLSSRELGPAPVLKKASLDSEDGVAVTALSFPEDETRMRELIRSAE